jgi:hypothetical protein
LIKGRASAGGRRVSSLRCGPGPLLWCRSEVGLRFELIGIAAAVDLDARRQVVQLAEFGLGEGDVGGGEVLLESVQLGGARDGHDPRLLGEQPGERNLPRGGALGGCDGLDLLDQCEVVFQRLAGEPRNLRPQIVLSKRGRGVDGAGEEALAKGD